MLKKLINSLREYKRAAILTPVYVIIEVLMEITIPMLMAYLIDYGINDSHIASVLIFGSALLAAAALQMLFGIFAGKSAAAASSGFAKNLRSDMYRRVQTFSFSNIDKFSTASIITRMTTDVTNIQNAFQLIIRMAIRSPFMMFFCLIISFRIDAQLSLIFLACIPVLGLGLWYVFSHVHPILQRVFRTYDRLNRIVQENLRGKRVVKSFNREKYEENKFGEISTTIYKDFAKAEKRIAFNIPLMQFCMYACVLMISWLGAKQIVASGNNPAAGLSTGELMSLITYTTQILMSLMMLSMVFVTMTIARPSAERITEILAEESDLKEPSNPICFVKDGSIRFEDVRFNYRHKSEEPVLDHINISIASGETVGIIGGTGSSKSSLVQLIPRLYDVESGRVTVGGVDVREYDIESLRNQVAMVLQKNVLFSGTIKDNLRWGDENASEEEMVRVCALAQADGFIRQFPDKYDTYIEQGGVNLSGGQKQRLCIARALLKKPKILILDDSTSAVDTKTDALIRKALREELPETTKIIITQRIASVMDADKIIVLDNGRIDAVGQHEELLKTSVIYKEAYESQNKGGYLHE